MKQSKSSSRRKFIKSSAAAGSLAFLNNPISATPFLSDNSFDDSASSKSIIGAYGAWANDIAGTPRQLSLLDSSGEALDVKKQKARAKTLELVAPPKISNVPKTQVLQKHQYEGLEIEELSWQLPYGNSTHAYFIKPQNAKGPLPAVLGLHDHGGNKYYGKRKICRTGDQLNPKLIPHQDNYYGGRAWANELAKRGYAVLVHDAFTFGSRRVLFGDMSEIPWGQCSTNGLDDNNPEKSENIDKYNQWASEHEHIMSKSLFCAGTTWPGVTLAEDQAALDVLSARADVDSNRIGCAGLSGGGLRTVYLGGLDPRIQCAVCVGFMTTWEDFLLYKAYTHTWMIYTPLLPNYLDFPEILGLRVPLPTMTLSNSQDRLFTNSQMLKADKMLQQIYNNANASDRYSGKFYEGDHKFDIKMQEDAFDWLDNWLTK